MYSFIIWRYYTLEHQIQPHQVDVAYQKVRSRDR